MSAVANLNAALDDLDVDQQRAASSIMLGYLWSAATPETQEAALAAMRRHVTPATPAQRGKVEP